jgi:hypothetical protein
MAAQLDGRARMTPEQVAERRKQAVRSAWLLAGLVLVIFVGSMLYNMGAF